MTTINHLFYKTLVAPIDSQRRSLFAPPLALREQMKKPRDQKVAGLFCF